MYVCVYGQRCQCRLSIAQCPPSPLIILIIMSLKRKASTSSVQDQGYYTGYDDPDADMVIVTDEGSRFRVHSYHLKSAR